MVSAKIYPGSKDGELISAKVPQLLAQAAVARPSSLPSHFRESTSVQGWHPVNPLKARDQPPFAEVLMSRQTPGILESMLDARAWGFEDLYQKGK